MPADDSRVQWIARTILNHYYVNPQRVEGSLASLSADDHISKFLDDLNCQVLIACLSGPRDGSGTLSLSCTPTSPDVSPGPGRHVVVLLKNRREPITEENLTENVTVATVSGQTATQSLSSILTDLFAPILLGGEGGAAGLPPSLKGTLAELKAGLESCSRKGTGAVAGAAKADDEKDLSGIRQLSDEFKYWEEVAKQPPSAAAAERAGVVCDAYRQIAPGFADIDSRDVSEVAEVLERTQDVLDALWKIKRGVAPFPEERMLHVFSMVGAELVRYLQARLGGIDIWRDPHTAVREQLRRALHLLEKWAGVTDTLTTQLWPGYPHRKFALGRRWTDDVTAGFRDRLEEISSVRTVHEQVVGLVGEAQVPAGALDALARAQPLRFSSYSQREWRAAVAEYGRALAPAEEKVAAVLRKHLSSLSGQPQQLLREFQRYRDLVARPAIAKWLVQEREALLGQLTTFAGTARDELSRRSASAPAKGPAASGRNLSEVVASIVWARQLISKVEAALSTAESLLSELPAFGRFSSAAQQLLSELRAFQKDSFLSWSQEVEALLEDPGSPIVLQMGGRLMELDLRDGKLRVNFHERLVQLLREVRQLSALGFKIPAPIKAAADNAVKFHRQGVVLKQVANFYNRVFTEMINSQKGMLLDLSVAFEEVVKNPLGAREGGPSKGGGASAAAGSAVTWSNSSEVELYIDRLQRAAERISSENWKLRKLHTAIGEKVAALAGTDLLRQADVWRDTVKEINSTMLTLQEQGYKNMRPWCVHWDHQLFKVLELQYRRGLGNLTDSVPEIKCELVFKQHRLQFRPAFEQLRSQYYAVVQRFIKFPLAFRGVGGTDIFRNMAARNAKSFVNVYRHAEELFSRLERERDQFEEYAALASVDLDAFVEGHLADADDWEFNFRMVKMRGRQADKLPASRKIGCISLSFAPVRATIDDLLQRFNDALLASLAKSIRAGMAEVEAFVDSATEKLSHRPATSDEIAEASALYRTICDKKPVAQQLLARADAKNRLLRSVSGQGLNTEALLGKWDNMELALTYHDQMVSAQIEVLKAGIEQRIVGFTTDVSKYSQHWAELKPKQSAMLDREAAAAALATMRELVAEYGELKAAGQKIMAECSQFGVAVPTFPALDALDDEIKRSQEGWQLYTEFSEGKAVMAREAWVTFRAKAYAFEEFLSEWEGKLRAAKERGHESVSTYVRGDLERGKELLPLLKFVRGETFMPDHWKILFGILGLPRSTDLATLTFGMLLSVSDRIIENAAAIKDLQQRANGEVTIRDALQDLKAWGASALFSLTDHEEGGRVTPLIKEWKEVITAVGDNQSLLSSLKDSPFFKPFADEARQWEVRLGNLDKYIRSLNVVQRKWVYLEPIFNRGALPQEEARFKAVDTKFVEIMKDVQRNPKIAALGDTPGLGDTLSMLQEQLDRCQTALSQFLEEKRSKFPRGYFLGDDDLLEILGQSKNPAVIQTHLKKLFQGIHTVEFGQGNKTIIAMRSVAGEVVPLERPVEVSDHVEVWLNNLAEEMKRTLRSMLVKCLKVFDIRAFPSQILNLAECIHWTSKCETAITSENIDGALEALEKECRDSLSKYTLLDPGEDKVVGLKVKTLVLDIIHNLDVIEQLRAAKVRRLADWIWAKQLRYYINDRSLCVVKMGEATMDYTYEYQGNAAKLVYTALTDKCYLVLTQGMMKGYGGNPYGPAGTGKTESVKALGQILGRQVLVFNCMPTDHQILTNEGFLFHSEIVDRIARKQDLRVACYDPEARQISYTTDFSLVENPEGEYDMVNVTHANEKQRWAADSDPYGFCSSEKAAGTHHDTSNSISIVVTANHNMYGRRGTVDVSRTAKCGSQIVWAHQANNQWEPSLLGKIPASRLLEWGSDLKCGFQFVAAAARGVATKDSAEFRKVAAAIGLDTPKKERAFLKLYGFWLGDGSHRARGLSIRIGRRKGNGIGGIISAWLKSLELVEGTDWVSLDGKGGEEIGAPPSKRCVIEIRNRKWAELFSSEYGSKCAGGSSWQAARKPEKAEAANRFAHWVWDLRAPLLRKILQGLRLAGGAEATDGGIVRTSSVAFRDELVRLCINAGFSSTFRICRDVKPVAAKHDSWEVFYSDSPACTEPGVRCSTSVTGEKYTGITWCVRVPTGLIVARRASRSSSGTVTKASRPVVIGNCDEGIDFKGMGRMFTGLIRCGAWGCFDEFNRLDEEVLSAVSQQIQLIQGALKNKLPKIELLDKTIDVDSSAGIFVTMNPAGKGYGGRSKLPDNLKQLFRPVAMSVPDLDLIAEVILYSEGFSHAKELGQKLVSVFRLSRQLLSPQQHYDWGLRALKSILGVGGQIVQDMKKAERAHAGSPDVVHVDKEVETQIVIKALRGLTCSKLVFADGERFKLLINDLFPGAPSTDVQYPELSEAVKAVLERNKLRVLPSQMHKILQLHENLKQRMGVVIVGPSGCGKSVLWRTLRQALVDLKQQVSLFTMNPKSIPRRQLLGWLDNDTREWTDGILTAACRQVVKEPLEVRSWVLCDGDIDPMWIESLNSVLDDNRLLTLPNSERIQFAGNVNFLFESDNLKFASPATVSRMGMIFMSEEDIDVKAVVSSWLVRQPAEAQAQLGEWIDKYFYRALEAVAGGRERFVVDTTLVGTVKNGLSHLTGIKHRNEFMLGIARGFGGNLAPDRRNALARDIFGWFGEAPSDRQRPLDCSVDPATGALVPFRLPTLDIAVADLMLEPMIPTVETAAASELILPCLRSGEPMVLVGNEGCGKGMLLRHLFATLKSTAVATLHCSSQTTAVHVIQKLNQACTIQSSTSGRVYRPKETERLVLYLKDINLPKPDEYETMQLISFLQQLLTYQGFYENGEWMGLERIQIVASMTPSTTIGRFPLSARFTAIVRTFAVAYPEKDQLERVYSAYLRTVVNASVKAAMWKQPKNVERLAASMVEVFDQVRAKFTPDDYPHYLFTPRDLTRWVLGLLHYDADSADLFEIWAYEAERIFRDRLVGDSAQRRFDAIVGQALKPWEAEGAAPPQPQPARDSYFVTWASAEAAGAKGKGKKLAKMSRKDLSAQVKKGLVMYEREVRELHLTLFPDVLDHIARIDRVLSQPAGAMLLVGKSGVGRGSATALVSFMHQAKLFTPAMGRSYNLKSFTADLKQVLQAAGIAGEQCVLLLEEHQLLEPQFIEYVNSLLSAGEVPGLYAPEELDGLLMPIKEQAAADGFFGSLFEYFVGRVRANLRVVLAMDPDNREFAGRCQSNPALYTRCALQWWDSWARDSARYLPTVMLRDSLPQGDPKAAARFVDQLLAIHESRGGRGGATPRTLVRLIEAYKKIFEAKFSLSRKRQATLQAGLQKLNDAAQAVDSLSTEAAKKRTALEAANEKANATMSEIEANMAGAARSKEEMKALSAALSVEEKKLVGQKSKIEEQLSGIQPMVDAARAAVGNINKKSLDEIRMLKTPGMTIRDIMEGVVRLMGHGDTSWNGIKSFLSRSGVINEIIGFDAGKVTGDIRGPVEKLLAEKGASFEPENAKHASVAAEPLAAWVRAAVEFSRVKESIKPLEDKLAAASAKLDASRKKMASLEEGIRKSDEEVARLKAQFQKMTQEASRLQIALEQTQQTLDQAQSLLGKLSGERDRWRAQEKDIDAELAALPAHSLLAAAFTTYLSSASEDARAEALAAWTAVVELDKRQEKKEKDAAAAAAPQAWSYSRFMATESELLALKNEGLPADALSVENALAIRWNPGTSLVVDPSSQATAWLLKSLKDRPFEVTTQDDEKFTNKLELSIRFGKTLVVQEVDRIHPILYPILRRDLVRQGSQLAVQVGDKPMTYNEDFRIFLVTRDPRPDLPPDARALLTEVNFTVTRSGLEGQLLMLAIQHERPELEAKKAELLFKEEENKLEMAKLEEQLLEELAKSTGNILENKDLIASLEVMKEKAGSIAKSLEDSRHVQEDLDRERSVYKPIAKCGSSLFFVMQDLGKVNHMYRFSLGSFLPLFQRALAVPAAASGGDVGKRIDGIREAMQRNTLQYVSRSLFKSDRLLFALHLAHAMHPALFQPKEWEFFTGQLAGGSAEAKGERAPAWVPKDRAAAYAELEAELPKVSQGMGLAQADAWAPWVETVECEADFPQRAKAKSTAFQRLLLVKAVRPDRLESMMQLFCLEALAAESLSPPALNLARFFREETTSRDPVLLVVTPGADPSQELEELAEKNVQGKYWQVAMGQGQQDTALAAIRAAAKDGGWVILKNLHLAISWLPTLEKELNLHTPHAGFRLWMTAEAHPRFSAILLQSSIKVTYEAPPGVKRNLERTFENWGGEFLGRGGDALRSQALFTLAWFHAIIQERRKYIPQSWTKFYEFNEADLRAAADVVDRSIAGARAAAGGAGQPQVDWNMVHGLLENAVYGGRVDNQFDFRILQQYLRQYFGPELLSPSGPKKPLAPKVDLPQTAAAADYSALVGRLPESEPPSFLGLPPNIDRSLQRTNSARIIGQLKLLAIPAEAGGRFNREAWAASLTPVVQAWQRMVESAGGASLTQPLTEPDDASKPPIDGFVAMEASNAHALAGLVSSALGDLVKVISGRILLSPEIQQVGSFLLRGAVPPRWEARWPEGPENVLSWMKALINKTAALDRWLKKCKDGSLLKTALSLSDLFRPGTFLDALRQQSARAEKRSVDSMRLVTVWSSSVKVQAKLPVVVEGLLLQGSAFEQGKIADAQSSASELIATPKCLLAWIPAEAPPPYPDGSTCEVPVYQNLLREKLVTVLSVPCCPPAEKWVLCGVSLFLEDAQ